MKRIGTLLSAVLGLMLVAAASPAQAEPGIALEKGDHVSLVGNALPERMNHFGWFETLLHDRFPAKNLVVRNIGYAGDMLDSRLRVQNYGSQDEWLKRMDTDVLLAFFGMNESFEGQAGVDDFKNQLRDFISHVRDKKYNGESAPTLVLLSPIAAEDKNAHDLPDGSKNNKRLAMYTKAMKQVANQSNVPFVDLFQPTKELYQQHEKHLTLNSVHLDEWGYKQLAPVLDRGLFGPRDSSIDWQQLAPLRRAVNAKNRLWFERYRVSDGYNVYGGRSRLSYKGVSNREVMKREMEILEQQTANRDKRVWHVARGNTGYTVKDDNLPDHIDVPTNHPGDLPGGKHKFLGPKEAMNKMTVADGFEVNLFASEKQFPSLINPVQMAFDTEGRLWVAAWATYPHWKPTTPMDDKLLILEDTDGDGRADKRTVFADGLSNPTGFEFWNGGVLVSQQPYITFLKDTDGDDQYDIRKRMFGHISSGDTHHTANSFVFGPGGGLHFGEGVFHRSQIETPYGVVRSRDGTLWRVRPDTFEAERYASMGGFLNPHGHVFTRWGQGFSHDGTTARPYHNTVISGHLPWPKRHPNAPTVYNKRTRPLPATGILSSEHFPEKMQGRLLVANVIGLRGIMQYELKREGTSYTAEEAGEVLIKSSDLNFRPVDIQMGPDGAIYFTDWQNPIIGHMQHHIRDPNRDQAHGRVYRITYEGRDLAEPRKIDEASIPHLLDLLKDPTNHVRYRAKIELSERDREKVISATDQWIENLDPDKPRFAHHLTEALWVHQWHNTVDQALLERVLKLDEPKARAAAARVVGYWRDRLNEPLPLLAKTVVDADGLVRLESVRALSFFNNPRAAELALKATKHEVDPEMDYTLKHTLRALESAWKGALEDGKALAANNPAGLERLLSNLNKQTLVNMPHNPAVDRMVLMLDGVSLADRREALTHLAEARGESKLATLMSLLESGQITGRALGGLTRLVGEFDADALRQMTDRFHQLAQQGESGRLRQIGMMGLMTAKGSADPAWRIAKNSAEGAAVFLDAVSAIENKKARASAYPYVRSLIFELPGNSGASSKVAGINVSYYGKTQNNVKISTLKNMNASATRRVDGFGEDVGPSDWKNNNYSLKFNGMLRVPASGKYTFYLASDDGSRLYLNGQPVINNDGNHGTRERTATVELAGGLHNVTVTYFQGSGGRSLSLSWDGPGFSKQPVAGKALMIDNGARIHTRAISLLAALPRNPAAKFKDLAKAITETDYVITAANAADDIAPKHWARQAAGPVAERILAFGQGQSEAVRGEKRFREAVAFGRKLAEMMPNSRGSELDRQLAGLVVKVIVIKAVPKKLFYDVEEFTVEAGEPVEIRFINPSDMPHNLLITKPGEMATIGKAAAKMAAKPNAFEKDFVPQDDSVRDKVLWATGLLNGGEEETLRFTAPDKPDDYPYVCTFPGHWRTMNGVMHVKQSD
jgi:glucose/arabinose dehydrogenase/lysophospholipase L1-like esterase/plastocyanin